MFSEFPFEVHQLPLELYQRKNVTLEIEYI
jgi:hypothetical protein